MTVRRSLHTLILLGCSTICLSACRDQPLTNRDDGSSRDHNAVDVKDSAPEQNTLWQDQIERVRAGQAYVIQLDRPAETALRRELATLGDQLLELKFDAGGPDDHWLDDGQWLDVFAQLPALEHLRLRRSPLTDEAIRRLCEGCQNLKILNLPQAQITAQGIRHLVKLPNLVQLRIGGKRIDDQAAEALADLPQLKSLHLIGPQITADGLLSLADCPRLASLYIDDCPLPDSAWQKLFAEKPNLHVHIDQMHHDRDPNFHPHD